MCYKHNLRLASLVKITTIATKVYSLSIKATSFQARPANKAATGKLPSRNFQKHI